MQESRYYQLFTAESDQEDCAMIIEELSSIKESQETSDLILLNYFNEIPVCFAATIDRINRGVVEITAHKTQMIAIGDQRITFLKSDNLQHSVFAKVQRVDIENNKVFLTDFSYALIHSARREYVRVEVVDDYRVRFECNEFSICGLLHDISIGGLSILAPEQPGTGIGVPGCVSIFSTVTKLEVPCRLLKIFDAEDSKKYVFKIDLNTKVEMLMSQFICQLQNAVITKMKSN